MTRPLAAALVGLLLAGLSCAPDREAPTPGQLSFESQITFGDGEVRAATPSGQGVEEGVGVIVGHVVGASITARSGPSDDAPPVAELANPTEVGGPLVFQLVEREVPVDPETWVEVLLPVRPNGTRGWVRRSELTLTRNPFRIDIDVGDHRLRVWRGDLLWLETTVAIGTGATPTPIGEFYVIELLQPPDPGGLYGPFAFGLSGFSETLQSFAGGDGAIGIHGTDEPEALGTDVSHGCVRVHNEVITDMAGVIPLGTPVRITA